MSNIQQLEQRNSQFERELNESKQLLRQKDANMRTLNSDNVMLKAELSRLVQQNLQQNRSRSLCRQCNMNCN
jgi:hypothetical protein